MALKGVSESLGRRGIQTDLKVVAAADAGTVYMLGSQSGYVQLGSNGISHVLDWKVTDAGLTAANLILGAEIEVTKSNEYAHLRPLAVGDTFKTDQLVSTGGTSVNGTTVPNTSLGIDPSTGKLRLKQATDTELFRLAADGGNDYDVDGSIWVEVVRLA